IHRLITALEERGFLRRLPHRARALEVLKLPDSVTPSAPPKGRGAFRPSLVAQEAANRVSGIPVMGKIAAGAPIDAIEHEIGRVPMPAELGDPKDLFALEVKGDSMIQAGILDGDVVVLKRSDAAENGEIVVALIDNEEATLKRLRRRGNS